MGYIGPVVSGLSVNRTPDEALRVASDWFERDRAAKYPIQQEFEEMYKLYKGDHWDLLGADGNPLRNANEKLKHPNSVENIAFSMIEGLTAEFSQDVDIVDFPVEPNDEEAANIYSDLKKFVAYKNRIILERQKFLRWFFSYGTGIWQTFWDNNWTGGRGPNRWVGDIRWRAIHPAMIFPDARCKESIEDGMRIHKVQYQTIEYVKERFPDAQNVQPDIVNYDLLIGENAQEIASEAAEDQVLVIETWYKGRPIVLTDGEKDEGTGLHLLWWAGDGNQTYLGHANYVYFEPGEDTRYPFHFANCYPRENSVWGFGELYFIKSPQINRNKTSEMIIEGHMHHALGQTFYQENAVTPAQSKEIRDKNGLPGMWFKVNNINGILRTFGQGVPPSLENEMDRLQRSIETIVGRFDISQGRTPGSVTAFRALDLLASRAQVRLRSKEMAITASYEDAGNYINRLIAENYNEDRMYRILGEEEGDGPRYGLYVAERYKRVYLFDTHETMTLEEFNQMEELRKVDAERSGVPYIPLENGKDYEIYSPQFDVQCKVSTTMPSDRLFYMDMAKELYQTQLIDAETFWYVMQKGKFPPFEELMKKGQEAAGAGNPLEALFGQQQANPAQQSPPMQMQQIPQQGMSQMDTQAGAQMGMIGNSAEAGPDVAQQINALFQKRPDLVDQLKALPEPERTQMMDQLAADFAQGGDPLAAR